MKPLSRLSAWFYDYPDFNVTEQEFAVLRAVKDGSLQESDLAIKLGLRRDELKTLFQSLRRKRLLNRNLFHPFAIAGQLTFASFDLSDPENVCLSEPGRKLLRSRSGDEARR